MDKLKEAIISTRQMRERNRNSAFLSTEELNNLIVFIDLAERVLAVEERTDISPRTIEGVYNEGWNACRDHILSAMKGGGE